MADYHIIQFERRIEAAALMAALSRYLNSPPADLAKSETNPVEIRAHANGLDGMNLYLNSAALAATTTAFSPLPKVASCSREAIPPEAAVLLTSQMAACGLDEALNLLPAELSNQKWLGVRGRNFPRPNSPTNLPSRAATFPRTVTRCGRPSISKPSNEL